MSNLAIKTDYFNYLYEKFEEDEKKLESSSEEDEEKETEED